MTTGDVQDGSVLAASFAVTPSQDGVESRGNQRVEADVSHPSKRIWVPACAGMSRVGGAGADTITGSKGHDLIVGGDSADTFFWSGGNDLVFGGKGDDKYQLGKGDPLPGAITFFGGEGDDVLVAPAGSGSKLYGGEGKDIIVGWSGIDELYGNDGEAASDNDEDIFSISNQTFVYNAGTEDKLLWGPFIANGGVKTWWMEGQFAYSMPFHGLFSAMPAAVLPAVGALAPMFALGAQIDIFSSLMLRYALSTSHQLVIQSFLGAGQAVVEDYKLDLESGEATAGIAVNDNCPAAPARAA